MIVVELKIDYELDYDGKVDDVVYERALELACEELEKYTIRGAKVKHKEKTVLKLG